MQKISHQKIAQVLADAAVTIRRVTEERDEAVSKLAAMQRREDVSKLAEVMQEKGISTESKEDLLENLEKAASEGRLDKLKDAVDLVGPDMWSKFAKPTDDRRVGQGGTSELELYLSSSHLENVGQQRF